MVISGLSRSAENLEKNLITLTASGHEVLLFQILDPKEWRLPSTPHRCFLISNQVGRCTSIRRWPGVITSEAGRAQRGSGETLWPAWHRIPTSGHRSSLEGALFDFLRGRMQRGKTARNTRS